MSRRDFLSFWISQQPWGTDPCLLVKFLAEKQKYPFPKLRAIRIGFWFLTFFYRNWLKFLSTRVCVNSQINAFQRFLDTSRERRIKLKWKLKRKKEFMISGFNQERDIDSVKIWEIVTLSFGGNAWSLRNLSNFWKLWRRIKWKLWKGKESKSELLLKFFVYMKKEIIRVEKKTITFIYFKNFTLSSSSWSISTSTVLLLNNF